MNFLKNQDTVTNLEDFEREVSILDRIRCPQIVYFYGAVRIPGKLALVTVRKELLRDLNF